LVPHGQAAIVVVHLNRPENAEPQRHIVKLAPLPGPYRSFADPGDPRAVPTTRRERAMATVISVKVRILAATTAALATVVAAAMIPPEPSRPAPSAPTVAPDSRHSLVGTWTRSGTCREMVDALHRYGLDEFAPAAVFARRFHPGGGEPALADSCGETMGRQLTDVFAPDGRFSALNGLGEQVDTAAYRPIGAREVVIDRYDGVQVDYRTVGATLVFDVAVPVPCTTQRCRLKAQYAVATFLPGEPWIRG
jgi:hypothetical protein